MSCFDELGEGSEITKIRLTSERTQPFFHAQIGLVIVQKRQISLDIHTPDYRRVAGLAGAWAG